MKHNHDMEHLRHEHFYLTAQDKKSERRVFIVVGITTAMMLLEITCGLIFNSMALLADGWHMSTHAGALGIAAFAYFFARKNARNQDYSFGTGKVNALGGFTSAVMLGMIAILVAADSVYRLYAPKIINFNEAIAVAFLGLIVNVLSVWLLREDHHHHHDHTDHHHEHEHHHDHNLKAAYLHVIADAFTSLLAVFALSMGKFFGFVWMDAVIGIIGSCVIAQWSYGLLKTTSRILLDQTPDKDTEQKIRAAIENDSDNKIADFHLWHIAPGRLSAIISIVTDSPKPVEHYKNLLKNFTEIDHLTIEVNKCRG